MENNFEINKLIFDLMKKDIIRKVKYVLFSYQFDKKICINWAALLSLAIFWLFGLHGYPTGSVIDSSFLNVMIILVYIYILYNYFNPIFLTEYQVKFPLCLTLIIIVVIFFISWRHLNQPISNDQIYHARNGARLGFLFIDKIQYLKPNIWNLIQNIPVVFIIQAFNFLLIIILILMFFVIPKILKNYRFASIVILTAALIVTRSLLSLISGSNPIGLLAESHPILRTLPLVMSSGFFGVSDFGYRMGSFIGYLIFLMLIFIRLSNCSNLVLAFLGTATIGTIPILWHVSYLVEQSIWSTLASTSVFVILYSYRKIEDVPLVGLTSLVILATMLRSPAFIAFIPIAIIIIYGFVNGRIKKIEKPPLLILATMLVVIVVILSLHGSPATKADTSENTSIIYNWLFAQTNNIPAVAASSVIGLMPLFIIGLIFSNLSVERAILMISALIFFTVGCFMYYAPLNQGLWGISRYQAELFVPLIGAGITIFCIDRKIDHTRISYLSITPLVVILLVNCFSIYYMDKRSFKPIKDQIYPPLTSQFQYPINEAFNFVRANDLHRKTYYIGVYYGGMIAALRGYSISEYIEFSSLNNRQGDWLKLDLDSLNSDSRISAVIIEPEFDSGAVDGLYKRGWQGRWNFINQNSGQMMIVMTKKTI